jgi:PKD repeat protein
MDRKKGVLLSGFLFFSVLLIGFISCSFEFGNPHYFIEKTYSFGEPIKGWLNISFNNEPATSVFEDSLGNSILLIDLLKNNSFFDYSCVPQSCDTNYAGTGAGSKTKNFFLNNKDSRLMGFNFHGYTLTNINNVRFVIESDAGEDCYNQLLIDFFDEGTIDLGNTKSSEESVCNPKINGCFNAAKPSGLGRLVSPYCQRLTLPEAPGFKLGARIFGQGENNLKMSIFDINGVEQVSCNLPMISINSEEGMDISCSVDYLVTEKADYYVCIFPGGGDEEDFFIRGYEDTENGCGFSGFPSGQDETSAYDLFAYPRTFDSVGVLNITNILPDGNYLNEQIQSYLLSKYGDLKCSSHPCIVPIRLISNKDQNIILRNLSIMYDSVGFSGQEETSFYDLSENPALVNAGLQRLYLDNGGFSLPDDPGEINYKLKLNGEELFSENLVVEQKPIIISNVAPKQTAFGFPTTFEVLFTSTENITSYIWDFGNGATQVTDTNKVVYVYNSTGSFIFRVTLIDSSERNSSYAFNLVVREPKQEIEDNLAKKISNLKKLKEQIATFPAFEQELFNSYLNVSSFDDVISEVQMEYATADSQSDYNKIISLLNFEIPDYISLGRSANSVVFTSNKNEIDLEVLKEIAGGNYYNRDMENYIDSILLWDQQNIDVKFNFKEFFARYESLEKPFLRIFEFNMTRLNNSDTDAYFVIFTGKDLNFKENYGNKKKPGYTYIKLDDTTKNIVFATSEDFDFVDLPAFISPGLDDLVVEQKVVSQEEEQRISKWSLFLLIISLLVLLGIASYIVLQVWYKKKYENYLFKNRNNLYNLITYINNSKKRGLDDDNIIKNLKKAKWNSEQINYVMRKYAGKRTGMIEIPIDKIVKKIKGAPDAAQKKIINNKMLFRPLQRDKINFKKGGFR